MCKKNIDRGYSDTTVCLNSGSRLSLLVLEKYNYTFCIVWNYHATLITLAKNYKINMLRVLHHQDIERDGNANRCVKI